MLSILIIFLSILQFCKISAIPAHSNAIDQVKSMVASLHLPLPIDQFPSRMKREIDMDGNVDQIDIQSRLCILECTNQFKRASERLRISDRPNFSDMMSKPQMNLTRYKELCNAYRSPIQCYDDCGQTVFQSEIRTALEPIRYICIDRFDDFLKNYRCMSKLEPRSITRCSHQCRQYQTAVNVTLQLAQQPLAMFLFTADEMIEALSGTCQFIKCYMDCHVQLTRSVCGDNAADLIKETVRRLMALQWSSIQSMDAAGILPEACKRLGREEQTETEYDSVDDG